MALTQRIVFLAATLFLFSSCKAQPSSPFAPEAGTYSGGSSSVSTTYTYGYNGISGYGIQTTPQAQYTPAPMGELQITQTGTNKGKYSFSKMKNLSGEWNYDPAARQLSFTGFLRSSLAYYKTSHNTYTIGLAIPSENGGAPLYYTYYKKATKPVPKPENPNGPLSGFITIKNSFDQVAYYDLKRATLTNTFKGFIPSTTPNHVTVSVGYAQDPHYYSIVLTDGSGKTQSFHPGMAKTNEWSFHDYKFGVLHPDGRSIALLGKTFDSYKNLEFTPGYDCVGIIDMKSGRQTGLLPTKAALMIKPFFFKDGRILYADANGAIAISSVDYRNSQVIYPNAVTAFALSPDEKTIAFAEGRFFYTITSDGRSKKQVVCGGSPASLEKAEDMLDMCWSPDGQYIGISFRNGTLFSMAALPVDGRKFLLINDEEGEVLRQQTTLLSWH